MRLKADVSQLSLRHRTKNEKVEKEKKLRKLCSVSQSVDCYFWLYSCWITFPPRINRVVTLPQKIINMGMVSLSYITTSYASSDQ